MIQNRLRGTVTGLLAILTLALAPLARAQSPVPPTCGPVILAGHDADDHGFEAVYAGLFNEILRNVTNGGTGILSFGAAPGSTAGNWIQKVAGLMTTPQTVTYVTGGAVATASFSGFAILHVPSDAGDTSGGISAADNVRLIARSVDVARFVNDGGGLFGLTQGQFADGWKYIVSKIDHIDVPPSGSLPSGNSFDDITATPDGAVLGITDTNLDGCCFHNVFTAFPAQLKVLARANEPTDPAYDGQPVYVGGVSTCLAPRCGDGVLDPGEECDDGNTQDGDGCSSTCKRVRLLGVQWESHEAVLRPGGVRVRWQTVSETDTLGFVVVRRDVCGRVEDIATVEARGSGAAYEILDSAAAALRGEAEAYQVVELTATGPGDSTPWLVVTGGVSACEQGQAGTRQRGASRH